ncbi:hypothetical protein HDA31_000236 [Micromonospora carbonacea subsp. aurantiaca]|nr:hypothetical protein [Micromonospora carbonacea]
MRRKGPSGPRGNQRTKANQWREVGEWVALALKVVAYSAGLVVTLAGNGCGLS